MHLNHYLLVLGLTFSANVFAGESGNNTSKVPCTAMKPGTLERTAEQKTYDRMAELALNSAKGSRPNANSKTDTSR